MKKLLVCALILTSCATWTPQQAAITTTSINIARIAAQAAATYYGGPAGGQMAAAGLDALAVVVNGYIGSKIPPTVVASSPGVTGVGEALVTIISPTQDITPADAAKVAQAAKLAQAMKPAIIVPVKIPTGH